MRVDIAESRGAGLLDVWLNRNRVIQRLSEHDLRDIEFALAQRRAMARRCTGASGEHTCGLVPGHDETGPGLLRLGGTPDGWRTVPGGPVTPGVHECRACPQTWKDEEQ